MHLQVSHTGELMFLVSSVYAYFLSLLSLLVGGTDVALYSGQIEQGSQLKIFAADDNGGLVFRLKCDIPHVLDGLCLIDRNVLKIQNFLRCVAGCEQELYPMLNSHFFIRLIYKSTYVDLHKK
jgi:hypothetical protein